MMAWCTGLPTLAALLFLMMPSFVYSAPVIEHNTEMDSYYPVADSTGCYYNFQHYDEGDRIITNEPCLNCTCHNRMLMCYLRVCPFIKAIGENCKVEKRSDQCCPIITCPEVPVHLLTATTTEPSGVSSEVGHLDTYGCSIDKLFYSDGARVPSDLSKPCELCYCIRNKTACVMQECTLHIEGCKPIYQEGVCCPVRYDCEHPEDTLIETTALPTTTTTLRNIFTTLPAATPSDCIHDGEIFADGALIKKDICDHCYCMKGDIVCAVQECGPTPLDKVNCTALPVKEGQCCPDSYDCENISEEELTTTYYEMTTQTAVKQVELEHTTQREIITEKTELEEATSQPELNEQVSTEVNEQVTPVQIYESQTSKISEEKTEFEKTQTSQPQTDKHVPTEISEQTTFAHNYENQSPEIPEERKPLIHPEEAITSAQQTTEAAEESYTQAVTGISTKPTEEVHVQKQKEPIEITEQPVYKTEKEPTDEVHVQKQEEQVEITEQPIYEIEKEPTEEIHIQKQEEEVEITEQPDYETKKEPTEEVHVQKQEEQMEITEQPNYVTKKEPTEEVHVQKQEEQMEITEQPDYETKKETTEEVHVQKQEEQVEITEQPLYETENEPTEEVHVQKEEEPIEITEQPVYETEKEPTDEVHVQKQEEQVEITEQPIYEIEKEPTEKVHIQKQEEEVEITEQPDYETKKEPAEEVHVQKQEEQMEITEQPLYETEKEPTEEVHVQKQEEQVEITEQPDYETKKEPTEEVHVQKQEEQMEITEQPLYETENEPTEEVHVQKEEEPIEITEQPVYETEKEPTDEVHVQKQEEHMEITEQPLYETEKEPTEEVHVQKQEEQMEITEQPLYETEKEPTEEVHVQKQEEQMEITEQPDYETEKEQTPSTGQPAQEGILSNEIESPEEHKHEEEEPVSTFQEKDESEEEHKPVTLEVPASTIKSITEAEKTSDITERPLVPITETIITSKPIYECEDGSSCDLPQTYEEEDNVKIQQETTTLKSIQTDEKEIQTDTTLTTEKSYGYPEESNEIFPEYITDKAKPSDILDENEPVNVGITEITETVSNIQTEKSQPPLEPQEETTIKIPIDLEGQKESATEDIEKDTVQPEYTQHPDIPNEIEPTTMIPQEKLQESSTADDSEIKLHEIDNVSTEKELQAVTVESNKQQENIPTTQDNIEAVTSIFETEEKVPTLSHSTEDQLTELPDHKKEHIPVVETAYEEAVTEENLQESVTEIGKEKTEETASEIEEEDNITQKHESKISITTEAYKEELEEVTVGKETIEIKHEKATELPNELILEITEESKASEKEHETIRPFTVSSEIPAEVPEITTLETEHKLSEHIPETENESETGTESEIPVASDDLDNEDEDHEDHILSQPEETSGYEKETPVYETEQPERAQTDEHQTLSKEEHKDDQPITTKSETPEEIEAITEIIPSKAPEIPESQVKEHHEEQVETETDDENKQKPTEIIADTTTSEPKINEPQIPIETITEQQHENGTPTISVNELIPEENPETVITTKKPEEFQIPKDTETESQENVAVVSTKPEIPDSSEKISYSEEISGSSSDVPEIPKDIMEVPKEEEFPNEVLEVTSSTSKSSTETPEFPLESSKTPELPLETSETPVKTTEPIVKTSENSKEEQIPEETTGVSLTASEVPIESTKISSNEVSIEKTEVPTETLENEKIGSPIQTEETSKPDSPIEYPIKIPESSTDAPESPFQTPKSTEISKSPAETSDHSSETLKTPVEVPEISFDISESPVEIPEISIETSESPVEIPESSSEIQESPIEISESSSLIPESLSESSEFPVETSELPTEMPEHPLKTPELVETPGETPESSAITVQPPAELPETLDETLGLPDSLTATPKLPGEIAEHPLEITEPLEVHEETSESSFITLEPPVEVPESPTEATEHPLKTQEPGVETPEFPVESSSETTESPIESSKLPVEEPKISASESAVEATEGAPEEPQKSTNESFEEPAGTTEASTKISEIYEETPETPTEVSEIQTEISQLPVEVPETPTETESPVEIPKSPDNPTETPELSIEASESPIEEKTEKLPESQENIFTEIPETSENEHEIEVATEVMKETKTKRPERIPEQEEMEIITDIPQPTSKPIESFDHVTEGKPKIPIKSHEVERDEIPVAVPEIQMCPPGAICEEATTYKPSEESKEPCETNDCKFAEDTSKPCLDVHGCKELHEKSEIPFVSSEIDSVSKPNECEGNINCEVSAKGEITTSHACLEGQECKELSPQTDIPSISLEQEHEKEPCFGDNACNSEISRPTIPQFCPEGENCKEESLVETYSQETETKHDEQPQVAGETPSHTEIDISQTVEDHTIKHVPAENEIEQSSATSIQIEAQTLKSVTEEPTQPEEPAQTEFVETNVAPELTTIKSIESNKIDESTTFEPSENKSQKVPENIQPPVKEEDNTLTIASTISSIKEEESTSPQEIEEEHIESITVPQQTEEENKEKPVEEKHEHNEIAPAETTSIKQDNIHLQEVSTELPKEDASTERIDEEKINEFTVTQPQQLTEEELSTERIVEEKADELNITQSQEITTEEQVSAEKVEQEKIEIPIQTELPKVSVDISQTELTEEVEEHTSPTESNEIEPQTVKSVPEVEGESATQRFEDVNTQPTSSATISQKQPISEEATPIENISNENGKPACKEEECLVSHTIPVESGKDKEQIPISQDEELLNEVSPDDLEQNLIPGEGSCLVDGQTYENNSSVPPINRCQISCKCISSILQCETVSCSPAPSNLENCMPIYHSPDSCCPTYSCTMPGISTIESDSHQMEITTKTVTSEPVTESKLNRETTQAYESISNTDDTTLKQTESPHDEKPEHTPIPEQPQYSLVEEKPLHTPIEEEPQHTSTEEEPLHTVIEEEEEEKGPPGEEELILKEKDHEGGSGDQYEITTESKLQNEENTPTRSPTIIEEMTKTIEQHTTPAVSIGEEISQATIKTEEDDQPQTYSSEIPEKSEGQEKNKVEANKITQASEHLITTTEAISTDSTKSSTRKEPNKELESVTVGAENIHEEVSQKEVTEQGLIVTTEAEVITQKEELIDEEQKQEPIGEEAFEKHTVEIESSGLTTESSEQKISHTVTEELSAEHAEKSEIPSTLDTGIENASLTTEKAILEEQKPEQVPINEEKISEEQTEESVVPSELDTGIENTSFTTEKVILEEQKPEQVPINEEKISEEQTEESVVPSELDTSIENISFTTEKVILEEQKPEKVPINEEKISEEQTEESVVPSELDTSIENISFTTEKVMLEEQKPEQVPIIGEKTSEQPEESVTPSSLDTSIENTSLITEEIILEEQKPEHTLISEEEISTDSKEINKPTEKVEEEIVESKSTEIPEISETESQTFKSIVTERIELDNKPETQKPVPAISENESTTSYEIATESTKPKSEQEKDEIPEIQPTRTEISETATVHENIKETEASTTENPLSHTSLLETEKQPHKTLESENEGSVTNAESQKPEEEQEQISTEKELVEPETQTVKTLLDENITEQEIVHVEEEIKEIITSAAHITESSITSEIEESKLPETPVIVSDTTDKSTSEETVPEITEISQEEKTEEPIRTEKPIKEPVETEEESIQTEQPIETTQPKKTIQELPTFEEPSKDTVPTEASIESVEISAEEHIKPQKPVKEPMQTEEPLEAVEVTKSTPENIPEISSEKIEVTTAIVEKLTKIPETIASSETSPEVEGPAIETVTQSILKPELYTSPPHPEKNTYKPIIPGQLHTSAPVVPTDLEPLLTTLAPHYHITSTTHAPNYEVTPPTKLPEHVPEQAPEVEYPHPTEEDYDEEETGAFGPGTCRYGGKVYVSAQQIPRDDPCDFCFCFRSDIICLQQSCPPPIPRCHEEPIRGFCCPRYECPVNMATSVNITTTTTTTTTTLPPHFLTHAYRGKATRNGCLIQGQAYKVGEVIRSTSGPCLHCVCGGDGQMQCDPKVCSPEPMLRQMIEATVSSRR